MTDLSPEEQSHLDELIRRWEAKTLELNEVFGSKEPLEKKEAQLRSIFEELAELRLKLPAKYRQPPQEAHQSKSVLSRCTDRARKVFCLAKSIGLQRNHTDIEPQDLFDGLLLEGSGVAANIMKNLGFTFTSPIGMLSRVNNHDVVSSEMVRVVVQEAQEEAWRLLHNYVGTEHQLMALMRLHPELVKNSEEVRTEVLCLLGHGPESN